MKHLAIASISILMAATLVLSGRQQLLRAEDPVPRTIPPLPEGSNGPADKKTPEKGPEAEKAPPQVLPFRNTEFGSFPHFGTPEDGGQGYLHYDDPSYRYDIWYRPHAFGWGIPERCAPAPFRPRGYGNLFAEPSTCYRMDYNRYVLSNHRTDYGPSYYLRPADQHCNTYDHSHHYRPDCEPGRLRRRTEVWTLGRHRED